MGGPWLNVLTEAPPGSALSFGHFEMCGSQQARVVEGALPRHCYLLREPHARLHTLHKADEFFCSPSGLKMKWTFNGMGWGIPHTIRTLEQG